MQRPLSATLALSLAALWFTGPAQLSSLLLAQATPAPATAAPAQSPSPQPTAQAPAQPAAQPAAQPRPLPEINALMRDVESHQYTAEATQKNYIYRAVDSTDELDGNGAVKKTVSSEREIFWLNGVRVARLLKRNGKELSPSDKAKEDQRIDKEVAKARERRDKADEQGRQTDSAGHDQISFARMLQLGTFSNERRIEVNGRDTILVDFTGDPKAKSHNISEAAFKDLTGTVAVDEQDKAIQHLEGHFVDNFKIGGGLVVSIRKGTSFKVDFVKINEEAWLPAKVDGSGHARVMLFFAVDGNFHSRTSDYRKFKASSKILPGVTPVDPAASPEAPPQPAPPQPASPPQR